MIAQLINHGHWNLINITIFSPDSIASLIFQLNWHNLTKTLHYT